MFCPQCGSTQGDELKFCKLCGANLSAVRQAVSTRDAGGNIEWGKTWVAEMFMSGEEAVRRKAEMERLQGITPEVKRYEEIKAGVITGCVGLASALVIFVVMEGIVLSGNVSPGAAEILSRVWIAGAVPLFVGIALIINGLFVSKKLVELAARQPPAGPHNLEGRAQPDALPPADTTEFVKPGFSVTEEATAHLKSPGPKP
ncbi:MAG TPA: hypothetical protein VIP46_09595 [Pyrinomonadaceae bacterium]